MDNCFSFTSQSHKTTYLRFDDNSGTCSRRNSTSSPVIGGSFESNCEGASVYKHKVYEIMKCLKYSSLADLNGQLLRYHLFEATNTNNCQYSLHMVVANPQSLGTMHSENAVLQVHNTT